MHRTITLLSFQEKEAQYYFINTQNLEMFPIILGQYYLKSRGDKNQELSFIDYFYNSLLNPILQKWLNQFSASQVSNLLITLENKLSEIFLDQNSHECTIKKEKLLSQINADKLNFANRSEPVEQDGVIGNINTNALTLDVIRFFTEEKFAKTYLDEALLNKICDVFESINIIEKDKLKKKLLTIESLWNSSDENLGNYFKRNFLKFPSRHLAKFIDTTSGDIAFNAIFDNLLIRSQYSQLQTFSDNYKSFNQALSQIQSLEKKAYNSYIELIKISETPSDSDIQKFISHLAKMQPIIKYLKIDGSEAEFILAFLNKIKQGRNFLLEHFCHTLIKLEKLHLITCLTDANARADALSKIKHNEIELHGIQNANNIINAFQTIFEKLETIYDYLNEDLDAKIPSYSFNSEQINILNAKMLSVFQNILQLFQNDSTEVIKNYLAEMISSKYEADLTNYRLKSLINIEKSHDETKKYEDLILELIKIERQQNISEQIFRQIDEINFLPILMTNEHFIDNTIYLHKISSSYIKNKLLNKIPKTASPEEFIEILLEIFISNLSIYQLEQLFFDSSNIGLINEKIIQMIQAEVEKRAKVKNIFSLFFNKKRKKEMRYASQLLPKLIKKPIDNISTVYEEYEEIDPDIFSDIDFQMLDNETVKHAQKLIDVIQKSKRT